MNIQNEFRDDFKKSNALKKLKETHDSMTIEDWIRFCDSAMKSAYDENRVKAVEYMLSFYNFNRPQLILAFQLEKMLENDKNLKAGEEMLKVLLNNFSTEKCYEIINRRVELTRDFNKDMNKEKVKERASKISTIILEKTLSKENDLKNVNKKTNKL